MVPFKFRTGRHRVEQLYFSEAKWVLGKCCIDFIFPPALRIFWWHPVKGADFMSVWSWLWNHSLFYTYIIEAYNDLMSGVKKYTKSLIGWRNPKRTFVTTLYSWATVSGTILAKMSPDRIRDSVLFLTDIICESDQQTCLSLYSSLS